MTNAARMTLHFEIACGGCVKQLFDDAPKALAKAFVRPVAKAFSNVSAMALAKALAKVFAKVLAKL